jgi:hypothetical protein
MDPPLPALPALPPAAFDPPEPLAPPFGIAPPLPAAPLEPVPPELTLLPVPPVPPVPPVFDVPPAPDPPPPSDCFAQPAVVLTAKNPSTKTTNNVLRMNYSSEAGEPSTRTTMAAAQSGNRKTIMPDENETARRAQ